MIKFTKDEKTVILFLLAVLSIGIGVHYYKKANPSSCQIIDFYEKKITSFKKININKANREELVKIKNIGPVLAERIVAYREKYGSFEKAEDIKNVKGIGEKTYEQMKKQIVLE